MISEASHLVRDIQDYTQLGSELSVNAAATDDRITSTCCSLWSRGYGLLGVEGEAPQNQ